MSLINKMLQDLDRRHAMSAPDGQLPPQQVRPVAPERRDREWFWRTFAVLMVVAVAWFVWVAWQLQPHSLASDAAFKAAESARRNPPPAPAQTAETSPRPAAEQKPAAETQVAPAQPPPPMETFKLAQDISTPIPARPREPASKQELARARKPEPQRGAAAETPTATKPRAERTPAKLDLDLPPARILAAPAPARVEKRDRARTAAERAETEFRRAAALLNQARVSEAEEAFLAALGADAAHEPARQALVALLLEGRRIDDARRLLQEGLAINPQQVQFALVLARILIERRDYESALDVLGRAREGAPGNAELLAMRGTALQRMARHREAVDAYEAAVRAAPQAGAAWLGLALSLEALDRRPEAADAYRRAAATGTLGAEVRDYAERRARALQ